MFHRFINLALYTLYVFNAKIHDRLLSIFPSTDGTGQCLISLVNSNVQRMGIDFKDCICDSIQKWRCKLPWAVQWLTIKNSWDCWTSCPYVVSCTYSNGTVWLFNNYHGIVWLFNYYYGTVWLFNKYHGTAGLYNTYYGTAGQFKTHRGTAWLFRSKRRWR